MAIGRSSSIVSFIALKEIKYKYICETCEKPTEWNKSFFSQFAAHSQNSTKGRFKVILSGFDPKELEKTKSQALERLNYVVSAIQVLLSGLTYSDTIPNEPFIAQQYNEAFALGKACPYCGSRQTWYPVTDKRVSPVKRAFLLGVIFLIIGAVMCLIFQIPQTHFIVITSAVTLYGAVGGFISAVVQAGARKRYFYKSPRHNKPEVEWGKVDVRMVGMPEETEDIKAETNENKTAQYKENRINLLGYGKFDKERLACWKMRGIKHENILYIHDVTDDGYGGLKIIEENFDGTPFFNIILQGMTEKDFQDYMLQLCDALDFLHTHELMIAHNAVAIDNILVGNKNLLKLTNFDQATFGDAPAGDISMVGSIMGLVRGKFMKRYNKLIKNCNGVYESINDLRMELLELSRPHYAKAALIFVSIFFAYMMLRRVVGRFF